MEQVKQELKRRGADRHDVAQPRQPRQALWGAADGAARTLYRHHLAEVEGPVRSAPQGPAPVGVRPPPQTPLRSPRSIYQNGHTERFGHNSRVLLASLLRRRNRVRKQTKILHMLCPALDCHQAIASEAPKAEPTPL